jgi:hypothetical protein
MVFLTSDLLLHLSPSFEPVDLLGCSRMQAPAPTAASSDGLVELESIIGASGLPKVPELIALFRRFHILSRAAASQCPALGDIVAQMFDMDNALGRLECSGYLTSLQARSAAMRACPSAASLRSSASQRCSHLSLSCCLSDCAGRSRSSGQSTRAR